MAVGASEQSIRNSRRRGFTFIEMMIAASISAMILAATATMVSAVSNAAIDTRDKRNAKKVGRMAVKRLATYIRTARAIGTVEDHAIVLWDGDRNEDDRVNLYEISLVQYQPMNEQLVRFKMQPVTVGDVGPEVAMADFTSVANVIALSTGETVNTTVIADNIVAFDFNAYPSTTETRIVNFGLDVAWKGEPLTFRKSVSPRASADYLFNVNTSVDDGVAGKPLRRTEYSRWTGWADVDGTMVVFPQ